MNLKKGRRVVAGQKLWKVLRVEAWQPREVSSMLVEYSKNGDQSVAKIHHRAFQHPLFVIRGSEDYTSRTARGVLAGLAGAERGAQLTAFFCGANDNSNRGGRL